MASTEFPTPQPPVTLQIPAEQRAEFEQLLQDFTCDKVRALALALAPAFDFDAHGYRGAAQALVHDPETTYALRNLVLEDDKRDPAAALADAEQLHLLQARHFTEAGTTASVANGHDAWSRPGSRRCGACSRLQRATPGSAAASRASCWVSTTAAGFRST